MTDGDSVAAVVEAHPDRVRRLFERLDTERDDLAAVREAWTGGNPAAAGRELLAYYSEGGTASWLRRDPGSDGESSGNHPAADALLDDEFTFQGVTGHPPREDGLDWTHRGPNDDVEWAYFLNRHAYFETLLEAYLDTGEERYAAAFDSFVRDWVRSNPAPDGEVGEAPWRTLEVGIRMGNAWPTAFYGFQSADAFTPAGRLLMLSAVPDQAAYLRAYHRRGSNWTTMELSGLARAAVCWPEFAADDDWFAHARDVLVDELDDQVYPDGVQDELTSHYHRVALRNFESFADTARAGGRSLPAAFEATLEAMWTYLAASMRPDGSRPLNNDSDRGDVADALLAAAGEYGRPEWRYVATNGVAGERPADPPSRFFEWAGQLISRSGWDAGAHWSFFDVGPWGSGHQHSDKLHLSVAAGDRDLLVDSGRFAYSGDLAERFCEPYATHSRGHNVVLVDGAGQRPTERVADAPRSDAATIAPEYDVASGTFAAGFDGIDGEAVHDRALYYRRGSYWVVADRIRTDRPRRLEALWQFHPDCDVATDGSIHTTDDGETNLRVIPAGLDWEYRIVEGQESPLQGWYSEEYNHAEPSPTAVCETDVDGTATFAWVLAPGEGTPPDPDVTLADGEIRIDPADDPAETVTIRGSDGLELAARDGDT